MQEVKELRLPKLISDGMVLQRNEKIKIWGYSQPNASVNLDFLNKNFQVTAGEDGKWTIFMEGLEPGGPYEMIITSNSKTIIVKDVYIGDVWLASGQSNMELPISRVYDTFRSELYCTENPYIRQFKIEECYNFNGPEEEIKEGTWTGVTPEDIQNFSAAGYFFAKNLYDRYSVPIGILNATKGGSPVEAWIGEEAFIEFPHHLKVVNQYKDTDYRQEVTKENEKNMDGWYHKLNSKDVGLSDKSNLWYSAGLDDSDWDTMMLPADFSEYGISDFNGVIWFRKEFNVPASMLEKKARLWLGTITDTDDTYVNGVKVGETGYRYPPRKYEIPSDLLKEGVNQITVRVICDCGEGGFTKDKLYRLFVESDQTKPVKVLSLLSSQVKSEEGKFDEELGIDLSGEWKYKISLTTGPKPEFTFIERNPCGLYNAMIAPLHNYVMKGAIWYQGESNVGRAEEYKKLFSLLIKDWRKKWGLGDFPFLYIQLVNFLDNSGRPEDNEWAKLRDAQTKALAVPNTAMVVGHDVGEWNDLHPQNKKELGYRLSLAARKLAYGENIISSGPIVKYMEVKENKICISFKHVGSGLITIDGKQPHMFEIKGENGAFIPANARIEGDNVVVWSDSIDKPEGVRYAWADVPAEANLYNKEGLPASCFTL